MALNIKHGVAAIAMVLLSVMTSYIVTAQSLQSTNYRFDESVVGTGGLLQANSSNYSATSATGDIAIGNSGSANFQIDSGTHTSPDPALTFAFISQAADFGTFTPAATMTATSSFAIANYTTYGYVVQIYGTPPTHGSHAIDAMAANNSSQTGVEQFGINLVANTSPVSFGANPNNGQFGFGSVMPNYAIPNSYRYASGDTIARAQKNSGLTVYTISYIVNVAQLTPGGRYHSDQTLIVTGTY